MTVTLDGKTLDVKSFGENVEVMHAQWDAWISGWYYRRVKVRGIYRVWTLDCLENDVAWASSQVKDFEANAAWGTHLTFIVTDEVRVINTIVMILGVQIHVADLAGKNIRYFTLTLQEV